MEQVQCFLLSQDECHFSGSNLKVETTNLTRAGKVITGSHENTKNDESVNYQQNVVIFARTEGNPKYALKMC